ncbi:UvrD-helicase domain-containing protein [Verminephrobacter eiseniae]|uniref:UvrD-helicase domain-containing protein n=1 Tax=Verminephrobacter eiseniae TaxID=364317 RepID=UPI0022382006|nr:UvrD-helicase domain-containing protein [Verminephrobacter eiseniae]MCW5231962.1 DNA helicase [Verminephrobacter eiseniae]MCW5296476.1 DNA helicase [Verminephrobacter eiseniae]MCW8187274.1 DNA helicase [Verminephrobacter eiseniae]MCW8224278.1 DNA helicase [Verminephrobacter eiseniae]MCW8235404.1 DNA helicase [Verminephrobacter eiseniae]
MDFRIADTFTDSLARLTGEEQKLVKTTAFDLQMNPMNPGMQLHRIEQSKDKHFWSARVSRDLRLIIHRTEASFLLCYAAHHDRAYRWAERRKLEVHPTTGAAQWVEIRERIEEIIVPSMPLPAGASTGTVPSPKRALFADRPDSELLAYGVPADWLTDVRSITDENELLSLADHLPSEAAEALLELATGGRPAFAMAAVAGTSPFDHPDAQRRFRVMHDVEELKRALDFPWDKWTIFLHPAQRQWVERSYSGPARIAGSAGTGKTIVALHRAVVLARSQPDSRVLLTTFSDTLAHALHDKLRRLISNQPRLAERLEVLSLNAIGQRLYQAQVGPERVASEDVLRELMQSAWDECAAKLNGMKFSPSFLFSEWEEMVDAWQLDRWESYRDIKRLGRKTRLSESQRAALWQVFEHMQRKLADRGLQTWAGLFTQLASAQARRVAAGQAPAFDHVVVDEAQDLSVTQLRFLSALAGGAPNGLFFAGDLGQRIFQQPFSWKSLGVDVRGRSRTLHINYRTSHQIRIQADRLLGPEVSDVDGNSEDRTGTVSVFNGPVPIIRLFKNEDQEVHAVANWLCARVAEGFPLRDMAVFVRADAQMDRARAAADLAGIAYTVLDGRLAALTAMPGASSDALNIATMHLAKGLEFRAVAVMACDDEVLPLQERIESVADKADLEEVYNTERHLLYVACTRARDWLLVTSVEPGSEFLQDLQEVRLAT